jgi:hypothetical protein
MPAASTGIAWHLEIKCQARPHDSKYEANPWRSPHKVRGTTTELLTALHRLPRPKGEDLPHRLRANRRLLLLLIPQLATDSGKGFPQISFHTLRVAKRRIEDGLHLTSTTCAMKRITTLRP